VSKKRTLDRWLKLKRKNTEDVNEGASCSKPSDLIQKTIKYDDEYLSMGFTCAGSEHEQQPQCELSYELLSNEAINHLNYEDTWKLIMKNMLPNPLDF
jgi:hypothetical protein